LQPLVETTPDEEDDVPVTTLKIQHTAEGIHSLTYRVQLTIVCQL